MYNVLHEQFYIYPCFALVLFCIFLFSLSVSATIEISISSAVKIDITVCSVILFLSIFHLLSLTINSNKHADSRNSLQNNAKEKIEERKIV